MLSVFPEITETDDCYSLETDLYFICFGKKSFTKELIETKFPNINFGYIKQVHSKNITEFSSSPEPLKEADAHFSLAPRSAPMIQTADCIPILVVGSGLALSIHAGWRGVEQNIVYNSSLKLKSLGIPIDELDIFIGPHISKKSFEVGSDIADKLSATYIEMGGDAASDVTLLHPNSEKKYIDLNAIAIQQLLYSGFNNDRLVTVLKDTFADSDFHSYRRDKTAGRQWSLCYFKNPT